MINTHIMDSEDGLNQQPKEQDVGLQVEDKTSTVHLMEDKPSLQSDKLKKVILPGSIDIGCITI